MATATVEITTAAAKYIFIASADVTIVQSSLMDTLAGTTCLCASST